MSDLSKNRLKHLKALQTKKYRKEHGCYLVEGRKSVQELLDSDHEIRELYATEEFLHEHLTQIREKDIEAILVSPAELGKAGTLQSNNAALAVAAMKTPEVPKMAEGLILALDQMNDPGNLGAILRVADWYGLRQIICSEKTVDLYNPKVITASKGSFLRVAVTYVDLPTWLSGLDDVPVIAAAVGGESVHDFSFPKNGILVIGSEANGISAEVQALVTTTVSIPGGTYTESLNAAVATGIMLDNIHRTSK